MAGCNLQINSASLYMQAGGETIVDGYLQVNGASLNLQGGTLSGIGTAAGGTLRIELGGTAAGQFDKPAVSGAAGLGGTLHVRPINGFVPQVGQQFTIMTLASRTGQFTAVSGPGEYAVTYNPTNVTLTVLSVPQVGDLNCDGSINGLDIDPFVLVLTAPRRTTRSTTPGIRTATTPWRIATTVEASTNSTSSRSWPSWPAHDPLSTRRAPSGGRMSMSRRGPNSAFRLIE